MRRAVVLAVCLFLGSPCSASFALPGPASLVADLNTARTGGTEDFFDRASFVDMNGTVLFQVDDGRHGTELWRTDGTAAGTALVRDVCPGHCSSNPRSLTVMGSLVFFQAEDGVHGRNLWRTDGTAEGTVRLSGLQMSPVTANVQELGVKALFIASSDPNGDRELWSSDGTVAGTTQLAPFDPGAPPTGPEETYFLGRVGSVVLFAARTSAEGQELWRTDGTAAGTVLLADIQPGGASSLPYTNSTPLLASTPVSNGLLYFAADDGVHGEELWVSDGTAAGTHLVLDIHPTGSSNPFNFVPFGTGILFSADDGTHGLELWKSDGTAGGTVLVKDVVPGAGFYNIREIVPAGTQALFNANDGTHGDELWVTDGTTAGTQLVRDIQPGSADSFVFWLPSLLGAVGSRVIFFADDGVHGLEPWASDGTEAGTVPLADVNPGSGSSMISLLVLDHALTVGSRLYFRAFTDQDGAEVWTSDGTPAGTAKLKEINDQTSSFFFFGGKLFGPALGALPGGKVLFQADDATGAGFEPWTSDGTTAGTQRIADLWPGSNSSYPTSMAPLNGKVLFLADANPSPSNPGLWISDSTAAGTTLLASGINAWPPLAPLGGIALMDGPGPDYAIWKTDGTPAGTGPVGPAVTIQGPTSVLETVLLFQGYTTSGAQPGLWKTDGSAAGTGLVHSFSESSWLTLAPASGNRLFFSADTNAEGRELWVTDGTPAGTVLVEDLNPGPASGAGDWLAPLGTSIVFTGDDGTTGPEPWISDGTPAGTQLLTDIVAGTGSSHPTDLTSAGGRVYFVADDGTHGRELWVTDGTPAGTTLFDLEPGAGSSLPTDLTAIGRVLAFSAWDQADGRELWVSDGTAAGTHRVQDIAPGPLSSSPTGITLSDKTVYFVANDNTHGFELWSVPKVDLDGLQDFYTVTPCRVLDTRSTAPLPSGFAQSFALAGLCGIPATARAVAANVTILDATGGGHLTLWPSGTQEPETSVLNFDPGMTRANNAILSLGGGAVDVRPAIGGNGSVQVVVDVSGYFQ